MAWAEKKEPFACVLYGKGTLACSTTMFPTLPIIRCIEALARAGEYEKPLLAKAIRMFEVGSDMAFPMLYFEFPLRRTSCNILTM